MKRHIDPVLLGSMLVAALAFIAMIIASEIV